MLPTDSHDGLQAIIQADRVISYITCKACSIACMCGYFTRLQKLVLSVGALARTFYILFLRHYCASRLLLNDLPPLQHADSLAFAKSTIFARALRVGLWDRRRSSTACTHRCNGFLMETHILYVSENVLVQVSH